MVDFSDILHNERSSRFAKAPKTTGCLISAGCAGSWYFKWISEVYGEVEKHIGLEYYSPKPNDLPNNVEWIRNTVGDMSEIEDSYCDAMISGQNIEHLWPKDVLGFLIEAHRTIKPGGYLLIDSPNREETSRLNWSHPEHMYEFTPSEFTELLQLAGFDVVNCYGMWLTTTPDGKSLPLEVDPNDKEWTLEKRKNLAADNPECSFCWWIEAVNTEREPQKIKLQQNIYKIFDFAWPERMTRYASQCGIKNSNSYTASNQDIGALMFGPYMPLPKGKYEVTFDIAVDTDVSSKEIIVRADIHGATADVIAYKELSLVDIVKEKGLIKFNLELDDLEFGIQTRVFVFGKADVTVKTPISIKPRKPWLELID